METPIDRSPEDDWVDQDLLTRDLAASLLDSEIDAERARLARLDSGENSDEMILTREQTLRRLDAMRAVRNNLRQGSTEP